MPDALLSVWTARVDSTFYVVAETINTPEWLWTIEVTCTRLSPATPIDTGKAIGTLGIVKAAFDTFTSQTTLPVLTISVDPTVRFNVLAKTTDALLTVFAIGITTTAIIFYTN